MYITIGFGVNVCVGLSPSLSSKTKKLLVYLDDRPLNEAVIRELLFVLSFSLCINIWGDSKGAVNSYRREDWNGKRYTVNDCIELTIGSELNANMQWGALCIYDLVRAYYANEAIEGINYPLKDCVCLITGCEYQSNVNCWRVGQSTLETWEVVVTMLIIINHN